MNLVLFGPPGAGKGTQSQLITEHLNVTHVSTGDLLRSAIKNKTALGAEAKKFMDAGDLVPDSIVIGLIKEVMARHTKGLLLDGFPRTTTQAEALDQLLKDEGQQIDKAIFLEVDNDLLKERLTGRRVCTKCGTAFHVTMRPPTVSGICDVCGGNLEHRPDDKPEVIDNRLAVYHKNTEPLKGYYRQCKNFVSIDGVGEPEQIYKRIAAVVKV